MPSHADQICISTHITDFQFWNCVKTSKRTSLTRNLGTNGLKVTSEPPPMAGQASCLEGQDRSAVTHPSRSHTRRCLIWLSLDYWLSLTTLRVVPGDLAAATATNQTISSLRQCLSLTVLTNLSAVESLSVTCHRYFINSDVSVTATVTAPN
ncbi:hypothetical protein J6590_042059 [Homalodisca vitripennis]|nr:hypothetical protein J6590_042059 [Homalodisca vitripennis]